MANAISKRWAALGLFVLSTCLCYANTIQVANVTLTGQNTVDDYTLVEFDISWENSWRVVGGPGNWDAAWVFVKYRIGAGPWLHAWINDDGHSAPSGSSIEVGLLDPGSQYIPTSNPGMGVFIYRSSPGSGTFTLSNVQLRWNYGDNGLSDNEQVDIKVFAIEHVYVPQGAFYVGSGGSESGAYYTFDLSMGNDPFLINSEGAINVGTTTGYLYYQNPSTFSGDQMGPIPAEFPKGFDAFYAMKYEISQKGYVDFLNTLSRAQQSSRVRSDISMDVVMNTYVLSNTTAVMPQGRNGIRCYDYIGLIPAPVTFFCDYNANSIPDEINDGKEIACSRLSWADLSAYLDWAGLRPMTEFEFEKASRGIINPVANEYVWGNNENRATTFINNQGYPTESPDENSNCSAGPDYFGPIRCGAFARATTDRSGSGASYFGIMELGGNVWERPVSVGNPEGRSFTGIHGNGVLSSTGNADAQQWPSSISAGGSSFRGGSWETEFERLRTSDRFYGANADPVAYPGTGGRGVRSGLN